jgi:hypothetical protein
LPLGYFDCTFNKHAHCRYVSIFHLIPVRKHRES